MPESSSSKVPCGPGQASYVARYFDYSSRFSIYLITDRPLANVRHITADVTFTDGETIRNLPIADSMQTLSWRKAPGIGHTMVVHCPGKTVTFSAPDFTDELESSAQLNRALTDFNAGLKAEREAREQRQRDEIYSTQRGIAAQQKASAGAGSSGAGVQPLAAPTDASTVAAPQSSSSGGKASTASATNKNSAGAKATTGSPTSGTATTSTTGSAVKTVSTPTASGASNTKAAATSAGAKSGGGGSLVISSQNADDAKAASARWDAARKEQAAKDAAARQDSAAAAAKVQADWDAARDKTLREMKERGNKQ